MLTTFVLALLAGTPAIKVDPDVTILDTCRISAVSFRNETDGWMSDHCGKVFRSSDGGRSWREAPEVSLRLLGFVDEFSARYVQTWLWIDERVGLAFPYGKPVVYRTEDGGLTWAEVKLPATDYEMVYATERVGTAIWFCGSSGKITRSVDSGLTWTTGPQLFEKAGFNPRDWCSAISFLDSRSGWASGWRTLHETNDGGRTWTALEPLPLPATASRLEAQVRGLVRLSPERAWARTEDGSLYFTDDGGSSWEKKTVPISKPTVGFRKDGRAVLLRARAQSLVDGVPIADERWSARGRRGVVNGELTVFHDGAVVRAGPATSTGSGKYVELEGTRIFERTLWGWSGRLVFRSDDDGASWYRAATLPRSMERVEVSTNDQLLAKAERLLFISHDAGRTWSETSALDHRAEWQRLTGENLGLQSWETIGCALAGSTSLKIDFGTQGCFGGTHHTLRLEVVNDSGTISGRWAGYDPRVEKTVDRRVSRSTSAEEVRRWIRAIVKAATQPERASSCSSTTKTFATIQWTCGSAPAAQVTFESYGCDVLPPELRREPIDFGYTRAQGVRRAAIELLKE